MRADLLAGNPSTDTHTLDVATGPTGLDRKLDGLDDASRTLWAVAQDDRAQAATAAGFGSRAAGVFLALAAENERRALGLGADLDAEYRPEGDNCATCDKPREGFEAQVFGW